MRACCDDGRGERAGATYSGGGTGRSASTIRVGAGSTSSEARGMVAEAKLLDGGIRTSPPMPLTA